MDQDNGVVWLGARRESDEEWERERLHAVEVIECASIVFEKRTAFKDAGSFRQGWFFV